VEVVTDFGRKSLGGMDWYPPPSKGPFASGPLGRPGVHTVLTFTDALESVKVDCDGGVGAEGFGGGGGGSGDGGSGGGGGGGGGGGTGGTGGGGKRGAMLVGLDRECPTHNACHVILDIVGPLFFS